MAKESENGRPLNNLVNRMREFEHFTAEDAERWTLPIAAAWFIWRDSAAVDDQWKIVTRNWVPTFDPPLFILSHHRRQPGTLACGGWLAASDPTCGCRISVILHQLNPQTLTTDFGLPFSQEGCAPPSFRILWTKRAPQRASGARTIG